MKSIKVGEFVKFGKYEYEVAEKKVICGVEMVGIYDEPPTKHIDYIDIDSINKMENEIEENENHAIKEALEILKKHNISTSNQFQEKFELVNNELFDVAEKYDIFDPEDFIIEIEILLYEK